MTHGVDHVHAVLAPLLRADRLGIITDIDGVLSRIAPTPTAATVDAACRAALVRLVPLATRVAAVSGRAAVDARRMVGVDGMLYVGNHGLERLLDGRLEPHPQAVPFAEHVAAALAELAQHDLPDGVLLENKGLTASVHYRLAPDPAAAAAQLGAWLSVICQRHQLQIKPGRMIYELRPPLTLHKGTAIADILRDDRLEAALFLGDDVTDVDGFKALHTARAAGLRTVAVGVVSDETPDVVRHTSDVTIDGVDGTATLLEWIASALAASTMRRLR